MFLDISTISAAPISAELFRLTDDRYAVMVSKNVKKFEWASMIMFNCGHPANQILTARLRAGSARRCKTARI